MTVKWLQKNAVSKIFSTIVPVQELGSGLVLGFMSQLGFGFGSGSGLRGLGSGLGLGLGLGTSWIGTSVVKKIHMRSISPFLVLSRRQRFQMAPLWTKRPEMHISCGEQKKHGTMCLSQITLSRCYDATPSARTAYSDIVWKMALYPARNERRSRRFCYWPSCRSVLRFACVYDTLVDDLALCYNVDMLTL